MTYYIQKREMTENFKRKMEKFPQMKYLMPPFVKKLKCDRLPFNLEDEDSIKSYLYAKWGGGQYRIMMTQKGQRFPKVVWKGDI